MNIKIANDKELFYQWDTGQLLEITDDGSGSEVHIEKDTLTLACAIREENGVRLVDVPDLLLQVDGHLTAYLVHKVEDEVETLFSRTFRIEHRAKPEDYVCTETEILHYRDLAERITALEQNGGGTGGGIAEESDPTVQSWAKTPLTAEVGQFFKVSAVENGKVTAVEAVEAPSGSGAGVWEHICDITTTEQVDAGIVVTENSQGIPLSELKYNEIWVMAKMVGVDTNTNNWWSCRCTAHQTETGGETYNGTFNGAVSGGTTGTKYVSYYFFIRGGKAYWTDCANIDPYDVTGGNQAWITEYLDKYAFDYFTSVTIWADSARIIGADTEVRILGRRA